MRIYQLVIFLLLASIVGCSGPSRDSALETEVSKLVETDEVFAMSHSGQVVINLSSQKPFEMEQQARRVLAEKIAQAAFKMHPDSSAILVGFGRVKPEIQQVAYSWKNESGKLVLISQ